MEWKLSAATDSTGIPGTAQSSYNEEFDQKLDALLRSPARLSEPETATPSPLPPSRQLSPISCSHTDETPRISPAFETPEPAQGARLSPEPSEAPSQLFTAAEVHQLLVRIKELLGRPPDWEEPGSAKRPYMQYFHRAVAKALDSVKLHCAQDAAQRGVFEWLEHEKVGKEFGEQLRAAGPTTVPEVLEKMTKSTMFWSQMRSASNYCAKDEAAREAESPLLESPGSPTSTMGAWSARLLRDRFHVNPKPPEELKPQKLGPRQKALATAVAAGAGLAELRPSTAPEPRPSTAPEPWRQQKRRKGWSEREEEELPPMTPVSSVSVTKMSSINSASRALATPKRGQTPTAARADNRDPASPTSPATAGRTATKKKTLFNLQDGEGDPAAPPLPTLQSLSSARTRYEQGRGWPKPAGFNVAINTFQEEWEDAEAERKLRERQARQAAAKRPHQPAKVAKLESGKSHGSAAKAERFGSGNSSGSLNSRPSQDSDEFWPSSRAVAAAAREAKKQAEEEAERQRAWQERMQTWLTPVGDESTDSQFLRPMEMGEWFPSQEVTSYFSSHVGLSTVPKLQGFFVSPEEPVVDLKDQRLSDEGFRPIAAALVERGDALKGINLCGNRIVNGLGLILSGNALQLELLDLSRCPLSEVSFHVLTQALRFKNMEVRKLALASIPIPPQALKEMCMVIARLKTIQELDLSDTQCGRGRQDVCQAVSRLCTSVASLDLSHNFFRGQGLARLGAALAGEDATLQALSLAENAWSGGVSLPSDGALADTVREGSPWHCFCEAVGDNRSLRTLNLSGSHVDQCAMICLEEATLVHPCLERLDVSRNPLGVAGLRAVLRMIAEESTKLKRINAESLGRSLDEPAVNYNPVDMAESYQGAAALHLHRPYHRCVLRLLVQRAERFSLRPGKVLGDFFIDGVKRSANFEKSPSGRRIVPTSGTATFNYLLTATTSSESASGQVAAFQRKRRIPVGLVKFVGVVKLWQMQEQQEDRLAFLDAVTRDLNLKISQVRFFIRETAMKMPALVPEVVAHFAPTMEHISRNVVVSALKSKVGPQELQKLKGPSKASTLRAAREVAPLLQQNLDSLTGHHSFDLAQPAAYAAADRLMVAMRWEAATAAKLGVPDLTQVGGHIGVRNFRRDGNEVTYAQDYQLPGDGFTGSGVLEFDYVTPLARPSRKKVSTLAPVHVDGLESVLRGDGTDASEEARFQALWASAHQIFIDVAQMRQLVGGTMGPGWNVELYVVLFPRCVDFGAPVLDAKAGIVFDGGIFSPQDVAALRRRLGLPYVFPALHVHMEEKDLNKHTFDLSRRDERLCFSCLLRMVKNEVTSKLHDCHYTELSERCDTNYWAVPHHWNTDMPQIGVVSLTYASHTTHAWTATVNKRRELAREMLGWLVTRLPSS